jgi:hypothetical protein
MNSELTQAVKATLWSYDTSKIDVLRDKELIITNVLNYGTKEATDWLFQTYSKEDIKNILKKPRPGEWNKKSLNLWSLIFDVTPELRTRF